MTQIKRIGFSSYSYGDLTIRKSRRMDMELWFVYRASELTKNIWRDAAAKSFVSYKDAKAYALQLEEVK